MSCDICTRFARYLYSTKQGWIINLVILFLPDTFVIFVVIFMSGILV